MSVPLAVPEFRPTAAEFADFDAFIKRIEPLCPAGAATIRPPPSWRPRANAAYDDIHALPVRRPIRQEVIGSKGVFVTLHVEQPKRALGDFRREADGYLERCAPPGLAFEAPAGDAAEEGGDGLRAAPGPVATPESLTRADTYFWKNVLFRKPTYGADLEGSLFDDDRCKDWNLKHLGTILDLAPSASGVHRPYLYVGMYGSMFCFHVEDTDLYGINFLHTGAAKTWYTVPLRARSQFEALCERLYPDHYRGCRQFMRHKQMLLSIDVLRKHNIPFGRVTQLPGTFTVVLPGVYHCGFNHGFNVAEAVNFATLRWLNMGKRASTCTCRKDTVRIDVEAIDRALFPGKYTVKFARKTDQIQRVISKIRGKGKAGAAKHATPAVAAAAAVAVAPPAAAAEAAAARAEVQGAPAVSPVVALESFERPTSVVTTALGEGERPCPPVPALRPLALPKLEEDAAAAASSDAGALTPPTAADVSAKSPKRRRNWAPIPRHSMADVAVRGELRGEERGQGRLDHAAMCGVEYQFLCASALLNTVNVVLRDVVNPRTVAALGRRMSKTRRRFLLVQTSMFERCAPGMGHLDSPGCVNLPQAPATPAPADVLPSPVAPLQPPSRPPSVLPAMPGLLSEPMTAADDGGVAMLLNFHRPPSEPSVSAGVLDDMAGVGDCGGSVIAPTPVAPQHHALGAAMYGPHDVTYPRGGDFMSISPPLRTPTPLALAVLQASLYPPLPPAQMPSPRQQGPLLEREAAAASAMVDGWSHGVSGSSLSHCTSQGRGDMFGLPTDVENAKAAGWGTSAEGPEALHDRDPTSLAFGDQLLADEKM
jgi:hypothetical protein